MAEEQMTIEPVLSELLSWREICARYPDEWVALVEIDWIDDDEFRSARVAGHGKTRREPLDQARPLWARPDEIGHFFTGPIRAPLRATSCRECHVLRSRERPDHRQGARLGPARQGFGIDGLIGLSFLRRFQRRVPARGKAREPAREDEAAP
jgi:hypothetical protein